MQNSILTPYRNKRVLITGASGFIGVHLKSALIQQGAQVAVLDQKKIQSVGQSQNEFIGDLRDEVFVKHCLQAVKPDVIFHLAAYKERASSIESFKDALSINLTGTLNLFKISQGHASLQSIVVMGTAEEYGSTVAPFVEGMRETPINAYSFSKLCVTHLCETVHALYGFPCVILRPTVAYGPGQASDMFLPALIQSLIAGRQFPMTKGEQTRDFIFITDLINAILLAGICKTARGQIVNIGSGSQVTIAELTSKVEHMVGNAGLVQFGALPYRLREIMEYSVNLDKASNLFGWRTEVSLDAGLQQTIAYYRGAANN